MKCSGCGGADPKHEPRDVAYEYKGRKTTILAITGDYCDACGESILDDDAGDTYMAAIGVLNRDAR